MMSEILTNKWFYSFIIGWIVLILLIDREKLKVNFWGGIAASGLELWQDSTAVIVGMYQLKDPGIALFKVPIFFTFGVVFTMGILFLQFIPKNPKLQLLNIFVFTIGFLIYECIIKSYGMLQETHWNLTGSFFDSIIVFGSLTWLKQYILNKAKTG